MPREECSSLVTFVIHHWQGSKGSSSMGCMAGWEAFLMRSLQCGSGVCGCFRLASFSSSAPPTSPSRWSGKHSRLRGLYHSVSKGFPSTQRATQFAVCRLHSMRRAAWLESVDLGKTCRVPSGLVNPSTWSCCNCGWERRPRNREKDRGALPWARRPEKAQAIYDGYEFCAYRLQPYSHPV
ncbi:hypothetical protein N658DRAFT_216354 [Parathielavia hyrcaniae]|uniref:Uncharacterized protein n=1 Tax=Parathielavia hyrcaniae TaxID=113614 RepID=A0AAN6SZC1_9PEZI|nr:hypothetical protein N658DRAFT_216354 [Parathielavia hyrcaniae]